MAKTTFGAALRQYMQALDITPAQLATAYGCNVQYVSEILNRDNPPSGSTIEKIASALKSVPDAARSIYIEYHTGEGWSISFGG